MGHLGIRFVYPLLSPDVDALRVLTVAPGNFYDPLECTLTSMTFSERPKYVALSYTWADSYPDMSKLPVSPKDARSISSFPNISWGPLNDSGPGSAHQRSPSQAVTGGTSVTVNGQPFHVGHNVHLALLHLRSQLHPISMWIDAICINQADTEERNWQVSLMSSIYTRAIRVIAWLGIKRYTSVAGVFRTMSLEWKAGETQHFAAFLAGRDKIRCSPKPTQGTIVRIAESTYWNRLWIVQEVCLPRLLVLVYGSEIWLYEDFRQWVFQSTLELSLQQPAASISGAMQRLLETRDKRHTGMMTLENLIERFARNECNELRDRVYGLLGCANDIRPFVGQDVGSESLVDNFNSLDTGKKHLFEHRRGIGSLRVDYSLSFYEIWTDVINFVFFQAKNVEGRIHIRVDDEKKQTVKNTIEERRISIVRIAGIVQEALGQKIEEEFANLKHTANEQGPSVIRAIGYIAGEIVRLGPGYTSLVGSSRAQQDWTSCWVDYYEDAEDLETLRRINEEYAAKILHCEERDVDRIQDIRNFHVSAWPVSCGSEPPESSDPIRRATMHETMWVDVPGGKLEPRICLGTGYVIGLVPPEAKLRDIIVRFWNCDAAIVMRPVTTPATGTTAPAFMLVGRADIAEVIDRNSTPGRDPHAEECMSGATAPGFREGSQHMGAVYIDLSLEALQVITACIAT